MVDGGRRKMVLETFFVFAGKKMLRAYLYMILYAIDIIQEIQGISFKDTLSFLYYTCRQ